MATYTFTVRAGITLAQAAVTVDGVDYDVDALIAAGGGSLVTTNDNLAAALRQLRAGTVALLDENQIPGPADPVRADRVPVYARLGDFDDGDYLAYEDGDIVGAPSAGAGKTLAYHRNLLAAGQTAIPGTVTALNSMVIELTAPPSGAIRLRGSVGYAAGSATDVLPMIGIYTEGLVVPVKARYGSRPVAAGATITMPDIDTLLQGLTPGSTYSFVLVGQKVAGAGTLDFGTPFEIEAIEAHA